MRLPYVFSFTDCRKETESSLENSVSLRYSRDKSVAGFSARRYTISLTMIGKNSPPSGLSAPCRQQSLRNRIIAKSRLILPWPYIAYIHFRPIRFLFLIRLFNYLDYIAVFVKLTYLFFFDIIARVRCKLNKNSVSVVWIHPFWCSPKMPFRYFSVSIIQAVLVLAVNRLSQV